jgi:biopolymer transport protein ExbB/TolQ
MGDWVSIIGAVITVMLFLLSTMLAIIGYLISRQLTTISEELKALPEIKVELAGMKVKVDHHSVQVTNMGVRVERIEEHVSNTERVALVEQKVGAMDARLTELKTYTEKELDSLRTFRHGCDGHFQTIAAVAGVTGKTADAIEDLKRNLEDVRRSVASDIDGLRRDLDKLAPRQAAAAS